MYIKTVLYFIFYILFLVSCVNTNNYIKCRCSINKHDNLKYFNHFNKNLSILKIPKNSNIIFSISLDDRYHIPDCNLKLDCNQNAQKIPCICPPELILKKINNDHNSIINNNR